MSPSFKIRLLWLLLSLSFIATALTIGLTFNPENVLLNDAQTIENNLHKKEKYVQDLLNDPVQFAQFKTLHQNGPRAVKLLEELRTKRSIYLFTYRDHKLVFWGGNRLSPLSDWGLKEGNSLIVESNGYYEAIKKSSGNFSVVCYIPVKARYPYQNQYLLSVFAPDLIKTDNLDIAEFNDKNVVNLTSSIANKYLFAVKLKPASAANYYDGAELYMWLLAMLAGCIFLHLQCSWIASKGRVKLAIVCFALALFLIRLVSIHFNWLGPDFGTGIFSPLHYPGHYFYPSVGDFLLNGIAVLWFLTFAYYRRKAIKLVDREKSPVLNAGLFILLGLFLSLIAYLVDKSLYNLVLNSGIRFDFYNILNLDEYSWIGILIICISILNLYLLLEILLVISKALVIPVRTTLFIFFGYLLLLGIFHAVSGEFTMLYLLFAGIIFIKGWAIYTRNNEFNLGIFIVTVLLFAIIVSVKLAAYQYDRDTDARKELAKRIEMSDDRNAVNRFKSIENKLANDAVIARYFRTHKPDNSILKNRLQKFYLDGYLTRYDFTAFEYDWEDKPLDSLNSKSLSVFKEQVVRGSIKVSSNFYRENSSMGNRRYFAIIPVRDDYAELGTLVIELQSKTFQSPDAFPPVLVDGELTEAESLRDYSFAFYKNGVLLNQYGAYTYKLNDREFDQQTGLFTSLQGNNYNHLVYKPNRRNMVVVSTLIPGIITKLGAVSFLFLVILLFSVSCVAVHWLFKNLLLLERLGYRETWKEVLLASSMLYKTRIQASIVAAVIITLVLVGIVTYFSISNQYREQQVQTLRDRINKVTASFENQMIKNDDLILTESRFNGFADLNAVDMSYFDPNGKLQFTTQPKIYENFLVSSMLSAKAFIHFNAMQWSEYINRDEQIGRMLYVAAYKPVRNSHHEIIGYLGLPYYSNEHDLGIRVGQFLNTLVNVYALVLVAIGFFAVFMSNQITYPLTIIQKSLRQTKIDRKNEPILWKRNDEIGSLIREYNTMIEALEDSAGRLARSERETAWKEMAKQVAHEIKNPLTPLKLGVQLLDKSWREQDPNFAVKFEKFTRSFVEQIESLVHIANEFSNFAKMPETTLENVRLREVIDRSIEVYNNVENVNIVLEDKLGPERLVKGDKDQLLRCFNNLLKNAIEAIPEGRNGIIRLLIEQQDNISVIELSDNGKGIADGLRERIFNPNFTTKSSGTGLGLAFVKQAIENMGGTITLNTELNKGTTFYIRLQVV